MRQYHLLFSFLILVISNSHGQSDTYHTFPDSALWRVDYYYNNPFQFTCGAKYYFQYSFAGDTIINSSVYKKLYRSQSLIDTLWCTSPSGPPQAPISGYIGAVKEDELTNKTYFVFPNSTDDSLLFDYNLAVGDTLKGFISNFNFTLPEDHLRVLSIDSVLINGTFRKRWNFSESIDGDFPFIIQGIGASFGLVDMVNSYGVDFTTKYLVCVLDNSTTYFTSDYDSEVGCSLVLEIETEASITNGFSVYPNPFSDRLILKTGMRLDNATLTICDSQGQLARQIFNLTGSELVFYRDNLPGGLYSVRLTQGNKVIGSTQIIVE